MAEQTNTGAQSAADDINWKSIYNRREGRDEDPTISALVKEAEELYIKKISKSSIVETKDLSMLLKYFNDFLKQNKYKFTFTLEPEINLKNTKKLTSKERTLLQVKEGNAKKEMESFISSLVINNNMPCKRNDNIESFFSIVFWGIYLYTNKKMKIDTSIYFNCSISLYRSIIDSSKYLNELIISEAYNLLKLIEEIIKTRESKKDSLNIFISNNSKFILESFWDIIKPKSISLYEEQKDIISLVSSNLDKKKLVFFEMPPANGKTILSAIIAKVIANENKNNKSKKVLLYICYNTIVRNEVAKLCTMHNVDVKFWLAVTKVDGRDNILKTFLRPFMNCYPDWNQRNLRTKDEEKRHTSTKWKKYSGNINDQFEFFINETRRISTQHREIEDCMNADNLPEMIISDLDSSYTLLKAFPDLFITYFDEAFASSNLEITSKIMSVLGNTVLVSATLAKPEEIPTVISDFKKRHNHVDDSFLHIVKSNKQHISCTFVNSNGDIFSPHNTIEDMESLNNFVRVLNHPLIRRSYSPEVVFNISKNLDDYLPDEFKFKNKFEFFGILTHETIREYAISILEYINNTKNVEIFNILKSIKLNKIKNMDINTVFTSSAINYQSSKTLHVCNSNNFNLHVENISMPFLDKSPKVSDILLQYDRSTGMIQNEIKSLEKNGDENSQYEKNERLKELNSIKLEWPGEFIMNSSSHATKFNNYQYLTSPNNTIFAQKSDLGLLDEIREKLLFSGIGVYQPEEFSTPVMESFLKNKDNYKFIVSTPAIVYGTNISLSIIDIDKSFISDSTKNTLYQLIGRAGRRGKSSSAMIIFRDDDMIKMILENNSFNIEAVQIEENYQKLS